MDFIGFLLTLSAVGFMLCFDDKSESDYVVKLKMSSRTGTYQNLFFAALTLGCLVQAHGQSAGPDPGQQIQFTAPDGQTTSNAPIPAAQAPQPQELPDFSAPVTASIFDSQGPGTPPPLLMAPPYSPPNNSRNQTDDRKRQGIPTTAEVMGIPTMEQIFGLPQHQNLFGQNDTPSIPSGNASAHTNAISFGAAPATGPFLNQSGWAQLFSTSTPAATNTMNSGQAGDTGLFSGLFSQPAPSGSLFGNNSAPGQNSDSLFGSTPPPQAAQQPGLEQPGWGTFNGMTPAPASVGLPQTPSVASSANSGLNSPSPFALPESPTVAAALPQLPKLPEVSGQTQNQSAAPAAPPSWAPKPPPWASSQPVLGTMEQRKF